MLAAPDGRTTRPMPDRVRESVFSMLGDRIKNAAVADLFAGSGAIGLEALSRGARSCLFVERDRGSADALRRNIAKLGVDHRCVLVVGDALGASLPARCPRPLDLAFLDPPYPLVEEPIGWERVKAQASALAALLATDGFLILRTPQPHWIRSPVGTTTEPTSSSAAPTTGVPLPRALRPRKYQRPRVRWEDEPGAERFGAMRRGGARTESRDARNSAGGRPAAARRSPEPPDVEDDDAETGAETDAQVEIVPGSTTQDEGPATERVPADLAIPGCRGPETHVYGKMAVHWYMRA